MTKASKEFIEKFKINDRTTLIEDTQELIIGEIRDPEFLSKLLGGIKNVSE